MKIFSTLFPQHWTISHRDESVQEQIVERKVEHRFDLDGRMTRWIPYRFIKLWKVICPQHLFDREDKIQI